MRVSAADWLKPSGQQRRSSFSLEQTCFVSCLPPLYASKSPKCAQQAQTQEGKEGLGCSQAREGRGVLYMGGGAEREREVGRDGGRETLRIGKPRYDLFAQKRLLLSVQHFELLCIFHMYLIVTTFVVT